MKTIFTTLAMALLAARIADAQVVLNATPTRVLGQLRTAANFNAPNLVEGKELYFPTGVALDNTASPPILYIADTNNNRVLGYRNPAGAGNGATADIVIGQRDLLTTNPQGPATGFSSGLNAPTGLAVDASGNLWVADSGNNRILRFSQPFANPTNGPPADVVVGQATLNETQANAGLPLPSASGLAASSGGQVNTMGLAFDGSGNLWVTDPANHRVLRFAAGGLTRSNPSADIVLGQNDFVSRQALAVSTQNRTVKTAMNTPAGIAFDAANRLFVSDNLGRVLVWLASPSTGVAAFRILGVSTAAPSAGFVNQQSLGVTLQGNVVPVPGVFRVGSSIGVCDSAAHRILIYPPADQWLPEASQFSPSAISVVGQQDFGAGRANLGSADTQPTGLVSPWTATANAAGTEIWVADTFNSRVVVRRGSPTLGFGAVGNVIGQLNLNSGGPNLVEGREFFFSSGLQNVQGLQLADGGGLAFDGNRLYVADVLNNRVLGFSDARAFRNGQPADLVIGQPDRTRTLLNNPSGDINIPTETGLARPAGVAVDANGDLYIADNLNGRVLRYPQPFAQPAGAIQRPNLVLGQRSFSVKVTDASPTTLSRPWGLAFTSDGSLLVSDTQHNRVLFFRRPPGGDFTNGQAAATVFGQPDFTSTVPTSDPQRLFVPRGIATDSDDRLYVADTGRARVVVFERAPTAGLDPTPALVVSAPQVPLASPHGVYVNPRTGEIWIADTANQRAIRLPRYDQLGLNFAVTGGVTARQPIAVTQDQFGNLFIADTANRIATHYPAMTVFNAANFISSTSGPQLPIQNASLPARGLAPNTYGSLFAQSGVAFTDQTVVFNSLPNPLPMPTVLNDLQLTVNDQPVPLHFVSPGQVNFLLPNAPILQPGTQTPASTGELILSRVSTGQILSTVSTLLTNVAPSLFTVPSGGVGQVAAINPDGSVNSPSSPIARGSVIQVFGTGLGQVAGAPPMGAPPAGAVAGDRPDVLVGTEFVPPANIQYAGLAPGLVGVWQVNVLIPENIAPSPNVPFFVRLRGVLSGNPPIRTTIAVRQQ